MTADEFIAECRMLQPLSPHGEAELRQCIADGGMTPKGMRALLDSLREALESLRRRTPFERAELEALIANAKATRRLTVGLERALRAQFAMRRVATIEDAEEWVRRWPRDFAVWGTCPVGNGPTTYHGRTWLQMTHETRAELAVQEPDLAEVMRKESN